MKIAKKEPAQTVIGKLEDFLANKHGDVDGISVSTDEGKQLFKFPPHTAKYVMETAKNGQTVEIKFHKKDGHDDKPKHNHLVKITNQKTGKSFEPANMPPPHPVADAEVTTIELTDAEIKKGKKDEPVGIVFKDSFVHIGPKETKEIMDVLETGKPLKLDIQKRTEASGFVNIDKLQVYHLKKVETA